MADGSGATGILGVMVGALIVIFIGAFLLGGGFGKVIKLGGKLPLNLSLQSYYNLARPSDLGPAWQLRAQATFVF